MKYDRPHYLFGIVLGGFFIFIIISIIPCQVIAATRYVAPGGNCGVDLSLLQRDSGCCPCSLPMVMRSVWRRELIRQQVQERHNRCGTHQKKKIALRGGYTTSNWNTSDPTANPTIIDANDNGICIYVNYQADIGIGTLSLMDFQLPMVVQPMTGAGTDSGGGIYIDRTTHVKVSIQNCKIYENYSEDGSGAGIWATRSDNLNVVANEIYDNEGSGVVVTYGDNTVIVDNTLTTTRVTVSI
jgi:parallel beta-helix repeat protein